MKTILLDPSIFHCQASGLAAILFLASSAASSGAPLPLENGDFETGTDGSATIAGWTDNAPATPGFWLQDGLAPGSFPGDPTSPQSGLLYLTANRLANGASSQPQGSTLSQVMTLSGENLTLVQSGTGAMRLEFYYQDNDVNDSSSVSVVFLDAASSVISSITTGTLGNTGPAPSWTLKKLGAAIPATTTAVRVEIKTDPRLGGTSATNVHFDHFIASVDLLDSDLDGLPDNYEQMIINADEYDSVVTLADVAGPNNLPLTTDFDSDGSSDAQEYANSTNPLDPDTDGDSLTDGQEATLGTNPTREDSDSDGYSDPMEIFYGSNPVSASSQPGVAVNLVNPGFEAPVLAKATEGLSVAGGTVPGWTATTNTMWVVGGFDFVTADNPTAASAGTQFLTSDRRAPSPDVEAATLAGGDSATMSVSQNVDVTSLAPVIDLGARTLLVSFDARDSDLADMGSVNVRFLNASGSDLGRYKTTLTAGNINAWKTYVVPVYPPAGTRTVRITLAAVNQNDGGANPAGGTARNAHFDNVAARLAHKDEDNDQIPDDWELVYGLDPNYASDASFQYDGDTLSNLQEFQAGTNPQLDDTDGDGVNDDVEVARGSDPLNAASIPSTAPLMVTASGFKPGGSFEVTVSGLAPTNNYRLVRGTDLTGFPTEVQSKTANAATETFTDGSPPTGKAFYRVEKVEP